MIGPPEGDADANTNDEIEWPLLRTAVGTAIVVEVIPAVVMESASSGAQNFFIRVGSEIVDVVVRFPRLIDQTNPIEFNREVYSSSNLLLLYVFRCLITHKPSFVSKS